MKILLLAGLAGFFGTIMRYTGMRFVNHLFPGFPWGTLSVNVLGAFIAGFCFVLCRYKFQQYEVYFPVLFVGFLGAFTTFSTFALESARFFFDAQYGKFIANVLMQNLTGLIAAGGGMLLAKIIFR